MELRGLQVALLTLHTCLAPHTPSAAHKNGSPTSSNAANSLADARPTALSLVESSSKTDLDLPAVLISPIKARAAKKSVVNKTDTEVWHLSDHEIIGMYLFSTCYGLF